MSYKVDGTTITLTRGDTFVSKLSIEELIDPEGEDVPENRKPYSPDAGDKIRFAVKADYDDAEPVLMKDIPTDTLVLVLNPVDTKSMEFGKYVYDIQLTKANGYTDTFIKEAVFRLTKEVD